MNGERHLSQRRMSGAQVSRKWGALLLALLFGGVAFAAYFFILRCIDGCGPYHYTASVADLDSDGDVDVLLSGLRHESDSIFWAGAVLWINQGQGVFTRHEGDFGGPSTAVGDLDGDRDMDIARLDFGATVFLNQGGLQNGTEGDFRSAFSIRSAAHPPIGSTPGAVLLGDLNNDGRLDGVVSYCCALAGEQTTRTDGDPPNFPVWVWINTPGNRDLTLVDDLPMRPALGDLDGDGDLDMYAAGLPPSGSAYDSADRVLLNDGSGRFVDSGQRLANTRLVGTAASGSVALGDVDGDRDLDALVSTAAGALIWINQGGLQAGQRGLLAQAGQPMGLGPVEAVFLVDLDADGDADALVAGKTEATVWSNDGQASFHDSGQRLLYSERHGLATGDFDLDGDMDVVSTSLDAYRVWFNRGDGRLE